MHHRSRHRVSPMAISLPVGADSAAPEGATVRPRSGGSQLSRLPNPTEKPSSDCHLLPRTRMSDPSGLKRGQPPASSDIRASSAPVSASHTVSSSASLTIANVRLSGPNLRSAGRSLSPPPSPSTDTSSPESAARTSMTVGPSAPEPNGCQQRAIRGNGNTTAKRIAGHGPDGRSGCDGSHPPPPSGPVRRHDESYRPRARARSRLRSGSSTVLAAAAKASPRAAATRV